MKERGGSEGREKGQEGRREGGKLILSLKGLVYVLQLMMLAT